MRLKIDPRNVNASTDLGIALLLHEPARSRARAVRPVAGDRSEAFEDAASTSGSCARSASRISQGAAKAWQQVLDVAPDSPEARMARQALDGMQSAHPTPRQGRRPPSRASRPMTGLILKVVLVLLVVRSCGRSSAGCSRAPGFAQPPPAQRREAGARSGLRRLRRRPRTRSRRASGSRRRTSVPRNAARSGAAVTTLRVHADQTRRSSAPTSSRSAAGSTRAATPRRTTATSACGSTRTGC